MDTGTLRDKGIQIRVEHRLIGVIIRVVYGVVYARIVDVGGIIRPVKAKALFIPLREGVIPIRGVRARRKSGLVYGVDYVLAQKVRVVGTKYLTGVIEKYRGRAESMIGTRVVALMR